MSRSPHSAWVQFYQNHHQHQHHDSPAIVLRVQRRVISNALDPQTFKRCGVDDSCHAMQCVRRASIVDIFYVTTQSHSWSADAGFGEDGRRTQKWKRRGAGACIASACSLHCTMEDLEGIPHSLGSNYNSSTSHSTMQKPLHDDCIIQIRLGAIVLKLTWLTLAHFPIML